MSSSRYKRESAESRGQSKNEIKELERTLGRSDRQTHIVIKLILDLTSSPDAVSDVF